MESRETTSTTKPFVWSKVSRLEWQGIQVHRRHARLYLIASWAPYALSAAAVGIGFTGHDSDHGAWLGVGALLFCIFAVAAPFYVPICLQEWWQERKRALVLRKAFWQKYQEDPYELSSPPELQEPRAPWE